MRTRKDEDTEGGGHGRVRIGEGFSLWSECELGVVGTPEATPATLPATLDFETI